jgi:hypothetical protein
VIFDFLPIPSLLENVTYVNLLIGANANDAKNDNSSIQTGLSTVDISITMGLP